jgi:hypothetical protein
MLDPAQQQGLHGIVIRVGRRRILDVETHRFSRADLKRWHYMTADREARTFQMQR